jgi:hypothetical protein
MGRRIVPLTLREADEFVRKHHRDHRHHPRTKFHRASVGLVEDDRLVGAVIVGWPLARWTDGDQVAEVVRLAADGSRDACSQLLGAAARIVREWGFARLQMVVEEWERTAPSFLRAAGFAFDGETSGDPWNLGRRTDARRRRDSPSGPKHRYVIDFRPLEGATPGRRKCAGCGTRLPLSARPNRRTCSSTCRSRARRQRAK